MVDRLALEFVTSDGLPAHFACWKTCDTVLASTNRQALQERAKELNLSTAGQTPAKMLKAIASALIADRKVPKHMVSLTLLSEKVVPQQELVCWQCKSPSTVCADSLVDFKIGSWPPGDGRRWKVDEAFVVPAVVCISQKQPVRSNGVYSEPLSTLCNVGEYKTISHVFWNTQFLSIPDVMRLNGSDLPDGLIDCPAGPCLERICLQLLNWFSMSGQDKHDKNYLPARVYLTRQAKLVCRGGSIVGYVTFNSQAAALSSPSPQLLLLLYYPFLLLCFARAPSGPLCSPCAASTHSSAMGIAGGTPDGGPPCAAARRQVPPPLPQRHLRAPRRPPLRRVPRDAPRLLRPRSGPA